MLERMSHGGKRAAADISPENMKYGKRMRDYGNSTMDYICPHVLRLSVRCPICRLRSLASGSDTVK
ncbi:MAG: hypothetical protein ACLP05_01330 [Candidatus Kryptoniota bacterium]